MHDPLIEYVVPDEYKKFHDTGAVKPIHPCTFSNERSFCDGNSLLYSMRSTVHNTIDVIMDTSTGSRCALSFNDMGKAHFTYMASAPIIK